MSRQPNLKRAPEQGARPDLRPTEVKTWAEVEAMRVALQFPRNSAYRQFSQAELCRRAGISKCTYSKGKKNHTPIQKTKLRWIRMVLEGQRHLLISEGESQWDY